MKQYGFKKATEFTKKQINVIYAKAKQGELQIQKFVIQDFYNMADYYGYDDNRSVEQAERDVLDILNAIFTNNDGKAQELINEYSESLFNRFSDKQRNEIDVSFIG